MKKALSSLALLIISSSAAPRSQAQTLTPSPRLQHPGQGHVEETLLSTCEEMPPVDPALVVRVSHAPGRYDEIVYDLNYLLKDRVLITTFDPWGNATTQKEYDRSRPASQHFSEWEPVGNEERVLRDVGLWVKGRAIYACQGSEQP